MVNKPTFILIGAAGYVAPKHLAAIKEVGGELVAAVDKSDAVGVLDRYFPKCEFYHNQLDIPDSLKSDYAVICLPNNQHAISAYHALDAGMNVILEKPATIGVEKLDELKVVERSNGNRVNCILQMRLHHDAQLMMAHERECSRRAQVEIEYHTPRGPWYAKSWKSDRSKSGGLLFNIGIHLFDLALEVFGGWQNYSVVIDQNEANGELTLDNADVRFHLSINGRPKSRKFLVNGCEYDFTNGFEDLHAESYWRILNGRGFGLDDARPAIDLCERLSAS